MSSSKIAESDSGAEDDIGPAYTYVHAVIQCVGCITVAGIGLDSPSIIS